jgi:leader peptidase (prepilin peptidase) / N-methyltransferase
LIEQIYFGSIFLIVGLLIGSFLNVCIYRIPIKKSVVYGRSYCPKCNSLIPWYCNIPILSYIFLGGKCKYCKGEISIIYPIIELLNGIAYLLVFLAFGNTFQTIIICLFLSILIVIIMIEYKKNYIRLSK